MNLGRTSTGSTQCVMGIIAQSFAGDSVLMGDLFLKVSLLDIYPVGLDSILTTKAALTERLHYFQLR